MNKNNNENTENGFMIGTRLSLDKKSSWIVCDTCDANTVEIV